MRKQQQTTTTTINLCEKEEKQLHKQQVGEVGATIILHEYLWLRYWQDQPV